VAHPVLVATAVVEVQDDKISWQSAVSR